MPQASDELRAKWGGQDGVAEDKAENALLEHGFALGPRGTIWAPKDWDWMADPDDMGGAVDFLIEEWDYSYEGKVE